MEDATKGVLLLILIGVVLSFIMHSFNKNYLITCVMSGAASSLLFCVIAQKIDPDPLIGVAFFVGGVICSGIALVIGLPFHMHRKKIGKSK
jgi:hypothetical protein